MAIIPFTRLNPRSLLRTPSYLPDVEAREPTYEPIRPTSPPMLPSPSISAASPEGVPLPSLSGRGAPTPYSPLAAERYKYVQQGAERDQGGMLTGRYRRSVGDILKSALAGAGQGLVTGGGIGAGIGGALAGGAGAAISPRAGREFLFETTQRPGIERELAEQQQAAARQTQAQREGLEMEKTRAEIDKLRTPPFVRPQAPVSVAPGGTLVDPTTGKTIFSAPAKPTERAPRFERVIGPGGKPTFADISQNPGGYTPYERPRVGRGGDRSLTPYQQLQEQRALRTEARAQRTENRAERRLYNEAARALQRANADKESKKMYPAEVKAMYEDLAAQYPGYIDIAPGDAGYYYGKLRPFEPPDIEEGIETPTTALPAQKGGSPVTTPTKAQVPGMLGQMLAPEGTTAQTPTRTKKKYKQGSNPAGLNF